MTDPTLPRQALSDFRQRIRGGVRTGATDLGLYATDASMYQIQPLAVIEPADSDDALEAVRICSRHALPIVPRGGGTSLTGQSINRAVVIDASRYCNRVLELNVEERWARVEPGLVRDELNALLKPHGLHFSPDPATSNRASIGGMIANNAAGMRSLQYGTTKDHVRKVTMALSDGSVVVLGVDSPSASSREQVLHSGIRKIVDRNRAEIRKRFPKVGRHSGGYALDAFLGEEPWNLAAVTAGSEGTLGFILEATVNLEPLPRHSGVCLAHFDSLGKCLRAVKPAVSGGASAVELLDGLIIRQAREHPLTSQTCEIIEGAPEGLLIIEAMGRTEPEVNAKLQAIQEALFHEQLAYQAPRILDDAEIKNVWLMRSSALGLITTVKGPRKPIPYIEDAAVPLDALPDYAEGVLEICRAHDQPASLFAHAGAGLLHIRPLHDLHKAEDVEQMKQIQEEVFQKVLDLNGAWSGEHGDGIVRGRFNRRFFGEQLYEAFREVKTLFDPVGLMNPERKIDTPPVDADLRFSRDYKVPPLQTLYRFQEEEGLQSAVEQCTGVGACRKTLDGTMCPSYMITRDEIHSTRGRANALRLAISGQLGTSGLADPALLEVFDLCLSCKGCRSECPNKVDAGKMKSEFLYHYYREHRRPLRSYLFANPARLGALQAGLFAGLTNRLLAATPVRAAMQAFLGIDRRRPLPPYAGERFSSRYRKWRKTNPPSAGGKPVLLFNDAYIENHESGLGMAAVRVLEAAGFRVEISAPLDSQRPALSQGMLQVAKRRATNVYAHLLPFAEAGTPIAVIEPSCASALTQDLPDLVDDQKAASTVASQVKCIERLLADALAGKEDRVAWKKDIEKTEVLVHVHCHQKAMDGGRAVKQLLSFIPGATVKDSDAGCCGMAGGFGYEKKHYDVSVLIAEQRLLPAVDAAGHDVLLAASGFSCRHQIADLAKRKVEHPVALLDHFLAAEK